MIVFFKKNNAFTTALPLLLTSFLLLVLLSLLQVFILESRASAGTFRAIATQYAADSAGEILLLRSAGKIGYEGNLSGSAGLLTSSFFTTELSGAIISARATTLSGIIGTGEMLVLPLFYQTETGSIIKTQDIACSSCADIEWGVFGESIGISGTGAFSGTTSGFLRGSGTGSQGETFTVSESFKTIQETLASQETSYLFLRNISATGSVSYALTASGAFSLPHYTILATAKTAQFEQKYQWKRALDISPDLLKYSLVEN